MTPDEFRNLLIKYQKLNPERNLAVARDAGFDLSLVQPQVVVPPEALGSKGIPTLRRGVYRKPSPLLQARFEFASEWRNADAGINWLSVRQMEDALTDPVAQYEITVRQQHWSTSPPAIYPFERITLFGRIPRRGEEVYLLWMETDNGSEPRIFSYVANDESEYPDLGSYLQSLVSGRD